MARFLGCYLTPSFARSRCRFSEPEHLPGSPNRASSQCFWGFREAKPSPKRTSAKHPATVGLCRSVATVSVPFPVSESTSLPVSPRMGFETMCSSGPRFARSIWSAADSLEQVLPLGQACRLHAVAAPELLDRGGKAVAHGTLERYNSPSVHHRRLPFLHVAAYHSRGPVMVVGFPDVFSEVQRFAAERRSVTKAMSSSCSQPSPVKERSSSIKKSTSDPS